jgi:hypothetical protein
MPSAPRQHLIGAAPVVRVEQDDLVRLGPIDLAAEVSSTWRNRIRCWYTPGGPRCGYALAHYEGLKALA